jgi:hypothetical protein
MPVHRSDRRCGPCDDVEPEPLSAQPPVVTYPAHTHGYGVTISGIIRAAAIAIAANTTRAIRPKFHSGGQRVGGFGSIIPCMQSSLCKQRLKAGRQNPRALTICNSQKVSL